MRFQTFGDVIDTWPSRVAFAKEVVLSLSAVNKMHRTDSVRGVYFQRIVRASAQRHGAAAVTYQELCILAGRSAPDNLKAVTTAISRPCVDAEIGASK